MEKRLKWNAVGLESKTKILLERVKVDKANIPPEHQREYRKLQGYIEELDYLIHQIKIIQGSLIPALEEKFRIQFPTPELILLALTRPSIRNIYENLQKYFEKTENPPLKKEEYPNLAASGDAANVLALIGDSILDLAVVEMLWDSSLTTAGDLTTKRKELVSNTHLAKVCDKWGLYQYRLKRKVDPSEENAQEKAIRHEKATLVEAIFGVLYQEFGFQQITRNLPLIQYP